MGREKYIMLRPIKSTRVPIFILYNTDFKARKVIIDKVVQYHVMIKISTLQEDITILNIYTPNDKMSNTR